MTVALNARSQKLQEYSLSSNSICPISYIYIYIYIHTYIYIYIYMAASRLSCYSEPLQPQLKKG